MPAGTQTAFKVTQPPRTVKRPGRTLEKRRYDAHRYAPSSRLMVRSSQPLYFFPEREVTGEELEEMLHGGSHEDRCAAISCMLRYAQWEDIWDYVSRDDVRELFDDLDLPERLRAAWARMLKIESIAT